MGIIRTRMGTNVDYDTIAEVYEARRLFGVVKRSMVLPAGVAALVIREGGDQRVHRAGDVIEADGLVEALIVRSESFELVFDRIVADSLDGYHCDATVILRVSIVPDAGEICSFRRVVMGSLGHVRDHAAHSYLLPYIERGAAFAAEGRGVEALIDPRNQEAMSGEMADALKGAVFSAGLRLEAPIEVRFESPVYQQDRAARTDARRRQVAFAAARSIEHAREEARLRHAEHLSELLSKLSDMAGQSSNVDLAELVRTFPSEDRGLMYAGLLAATDGCAATQSVVVGAGRELLFFEPGGLEAPRRRLVLPESAGPIRSVQPAIDGRGTRLLLAGTSTGVHELAGNGEGGVKTYEFEPAGAVRGGVNSATLCGEHLIATHSELGLLCWRRGSHPTVRRLVEERTRSAGAVRCARFFEGHVWFSIDNQVFRLPADALDAEPTAYSGSASLICALQPTADGLFAGNADGQVLHWPNDTVQDPQLIHEGRQRSAETVVLSGWGALKRLYFTDTSSAVHLRVLGDSFVCRYEAGGQTLRRAAVASDMIVGVNESRDRLLFWRHGQPDRPFDIAPIGRMTGRSIQDVCLIPA